MESPVMTSASSHRLRSAVSACAQPTHSYLSSSYLGSSIQSESHHSGGCFKKFNNSGKNGDSSLFDKLNITKKSQPSTDYSIFHKRHKPCLKNSLSHCCATKLHHKAKHNEKEVSAGVLNLIPKQFAVRNDFLSKIKLNENLLESKKLGNFPAGVNESADKVKGSHKGSNNSINKKNLNGSCTGSKVLNHRYNNCDKNKSKKNLEVSVFGTQDSINDGSELSDECPTHCSLVDLEEGVRSQEISKWQPKHVVTRRTAQILRLVQNVWKTRLGSSKTAPTENIQYLLNDLNFFPSAHEVDCWIDCDTNRYKLKEQNTGKSWKSYVSEMIEYAKESTENQSYLTFNDFYEICSKFTKNKGYSLSQPTLLASVDKNVCIFKRKFSDDMGKHEVFLGGSCNPTTWRKDIAIPTLEEMGITYYNPQVEEWTPDLLEAEYRAKQCAKIMFFVIDNQTRGVSAIIEVAYLAGCKRKLILVIQCQPEDNVKINDEEISEAEIKDLKMGRGVLEEIAKNQCVPVFDDIKKALKRTEEMLKKNSDCENEEEEECCNEKEELKPDEVFEKLDAKNSGEINIDDVTLGLKMLLNEDISQETIECLIKKDGEEKCLQDMKFDCEAFMKLYEEIKKNPEDRKSENKSCCSICRDVYLGGTTENTCWREITAIPMLQSQNLTYFIPKLNEEPKHFPHIEEVIIENSFISLFVITCTARSIADMAIAGHYIGKGANVVLCVQQLPEKATVGCEQLTDAAVKDYNRGRTYLMDIAERNGVPVFDELQTVMSYAIQKCRER